MMHLWQCCKMWVQIAALPSSVANPLALPAESLGKLRQHGKPHWRVQAWCATSCAGWAPVPHAAQAQRVFPWELRSLHGRLPKQPCSRCRAMGQRQLPASPAPGSEKEPSQGLDSHWTQGWEEHVAWESFGREAWRRQNTPCVTPSFLRKRCLCRHSASPLALSTPLKSVSKD